MSVPVIKAPAEIIQPALEIATRSAGPAMNPARSSAAAAPMAPGGASRPGRATREAIQAAAAAIEKHLRDEGRQLAFSVDDSTGQTVVTVRNPSTGDVIRQVPSEEALRIARNLDASTHRLVNELA